MTKAERRALISLLEGQALILSSLRPLVNEDRRDVLHSQAAMSLAAANELLREQEAGEVEPSGEW